MATEMISRPAPEKKKAARPAAAKPAQPAKPAKPKPRKKAKPSKVKPLESVRRALELMKPQLAVALPPHLPADRLLRVVLTVLQTTPALLECDRASLYRAVVTCAQLGLEPDGVLGQAYLVPSRGKVQLVPGYRGFIALARNSGEVTSINAQAVHRNDRFDFAFGLAERLEHVPASGDRGEITHFYAYARFKDGGHHFDVMSRGEVDAVRDRSESYQAYRAGKVVDTAWVTGYAEMGKKTVIRRIAKFLPLTVQKAAALADLYESGQHAVLDDLGEIVVDQPEVEEIQAEEPAPRSRLDAFAAAGWDGRAEVPPREPPSATMEGLDLSDAEVEGLFPAAHIIRILDAVVEREIPEDVLAQIVGKPLDDVTEEDEAEILRAIGEWRAGA
jgi:recombination protein RecT